MDLCLKVVERKPMSARIVHISKHRREVYKRR